MVINSNFEAQRTADYMLTNQKGLQKSLSRLSSGSKIVSVADDAAGVAVSTRMESQLRRIEAVMTGLSTVTSLTQTQNGYLKTVTDALARMSELATLAQDYTKNSTDRALYQKEYNQLNELVYETQSKQFTGIHLFKTLTNGYESVSVTIDENGEQFTIPPVDFSTSTFTDAIKAPGSENSLLTAEDAQKTAESVIKLLDHANQPF